MFDDDVIEEASKYQTLGPAYFEARKVAERVLANFEAEHFKPLVDSVVKEINDKIWESVQDCLLCDTEMNIQGEIWRTVDECVAALLGGKKWAFDKYVLGERYDCDEIRAVVAKHIPAELQDARIKDLEAENASLKERIEWLDRRDFR